MCQNDIIYYKNAQNHENKIKLVNNYIKYKKKCKELKKINNDKDKKIKDQDKKIKKQQNLIDKLQNGLGKKSERFWTEKILNTRFILPVTTVLPVTLQNRFLLLIWVIRTVLAKRKIWLSWAGTGL